MSLGSQSNNNSKVGIGGHGYIKLSALPKDEHMFGIWKLKVEASIRGAGLIEVLENDYHKLMSLTREKLNIYKRERDVEHKEEVKDLTQEQKDLLLNQSYKVYAALADTLTTADQLRILLNKKNVPDGDAYRLWIAIKERYDIRTTDATKERLWEIFNGMKMKDGDDFKSYKGKVEEAVANLYTVQEEVPLSRIKAKIITGLSTRYGAFVGALYTQDHNQMTMVDLCKKINDFEESTVFKNSTSVTADEDLGFTSYANEEKKSKFQNKNGTNSHQKGKNAKECFTCHKIGHIAYECYANKNKKKCSRCKKVGHSDQECYSNKNNKKDSKDSKAEGKEDNNTEFGNFFAPVFPVSTDIPLNENIWILDSGASKHLCTNKKLMSDMKTATPPITMKCANKQSVTLQQTGDVRLQTMNGSKGSCVILQNVAYAPTFQCNIVSVGKLVEAGLKVTFGTNGAMAFIEDGKPVITACKFGNLFIVAVVNESEYAQLASQSDKDNDKDAETELWHCRLGHIAYEGLQRLILGQTVTGLPIEKSNNPSKNSMKCDSCIKGKQHRHPFNKEWNDKAEEVLDRVHADLCGPIRKDRTGKLYLSTIIDERSRMIFGELIALKSDAAQGIITWCNRAKTYQRKTVIEFHSDGGGEYRGKSLLKYFAEEGIQPTSTLPSTPQHNPIAERINRTVFECARTMLTHSGLPKEFWGDAVLYAIYIRNRCLTTVDKKKSPYELWTGKKPSVSHIRVFGCDAYMHVKDEDRSKMEDKSIKCILIGYSEYNRGYKLYALEIRKVYYSRDVLFQEHSFKHAVALNEKQSEPKVGQPISDNYFQPQSDKDEEENEKFSDFTDSFDKEDDPVDKRPLVDADPEKKEIVKELEIKSQEEQAVEEDKQPEQQIDLSRLPKQVRGLMWAITMLYFNLQKITNVK